VHLRHVRAPQHECIGGLEIVVTAHRLIHAESAHEPHDGRRHAVAGVRVEIVGPEASFEQFVSSVAFPDRPLTGPEHADGGRAALLECFFEFVGHHIESFIPGNLGELAVLVVAAVLFAKQRMGQAIITVQDF
jgi:hypothetical protein